MVLANRLIDKNAGKKEIETNKDPEFHRAVTGLSLLEKAKQNFESYQSKPETLKFKPFVKAANRRGGVSLVFNSD